MKNKRHEPHWRRHCRKCPNRISKERVDPLCDECRAANPKPTGNGYHHAPDREHRFCGLGHILNNGCGVRLHPGEDILCGQCREVQDRAARWTDLPERKGA